MVDENSPRVSHLLGLRISPSGEPSVEVKLASGKTAELMISEDGAVKPSQAAEGTEAKDIESGKPLVVQGKEIIAGSLPDLQKPLDAVAGKDKTTWVIDQTEAGTEVKQYSGDGEFLRRLAPAAGEIEIRDFQLRHVPLQSFPEVEV